jgi:hypothetical protein
MSKASKLYYVWHSMKKRCELQAYFQYPRYGGRGIKLCEEWHNYQNFKAWAESNGYVEGLSIDRINNDGNYEPQNCRWITLQQQNRNKSTNRQVTYNDITLPMCSWCKVFSLPSSTLERRLDDGWNIKDALFTPSGEYLNYDQRKTRRPAPSNSPRCAHEILVCNVLSGSDVLQPCIEGPCPNYVPPQEEPK